MTWFKHFGRACVIDMARTCEIFTSMWPLGRGNILPHNTLQISLLLTPYPFPKRQILGSPEMKVFAEDNLRFDENGSKFSKKVESTVGKGEIARYEQFLLFPQCFQKTFTEDTNKPGLTWERANMLMAISMYNTRCIFLPIQSTNRLPSDPEAED